MLWERYSPRTPFFVTSMAALFSIFPAWFKFKLPKNGNPPLVNVTDEMAVK
jgi:hypothetical protein